MVPQAHDQIILNRITTFVNRILSYKSAVLANQDDKDLDELEVELVSRTPSHLICLDLTCFKNKYFIFLAKLKGGLGLETLDVVVKFADELEDLPEPNVKSVGITSNIRKSAAQLSQKASGAAPLAFAGTPPSTPIASTSADTTQLTFSAFSPFLIPTSTPKKRRIDIAVDKIREAAATDLFNENIRLRKELATTQEQLRLSEARFQNLRKLLVQKNVQ